MLLYSCYTDGAGLDVELVDGVMSLGKEWAGRAFTIYASIKVTNRGGFCFMGIDLKFIKSFYKLLTLDMLLSSLF